MGTRLRPATTHCPKVLLEVGPRGETILQLLVEQCQKVGMTEVMVIVGHGSSEVTSYLDQWASPLPIRTIFNPDYAIMNNGRSLQVAQTELSGRNFVKFDGDLVLHPEILPRLMAAAWPSALLLDTDKVLNDEDMKALVDSKSGRVLKLGKGLPNTSSGVSIGVERIAAADTEIVFEALERMIGRESFGDGYYEDAYQRAFEAEFSMGHVSTGGLPWIEIDTPDEMVVARDLFRDL